MLHGDIVSGSFAAGAICDALSKYLTAREGQKKESLFLHQVSPDFSFLFLSPGRVHFAGTKNPNKSNPIKRQPWSKEPRKLGARRKAALQR